MSQIEIYMKKYGWECEPASDGTLPKIKEDAVMQFLFGKSIFAHFEGHLKVDQPPMESRRGNFVWHDDNTTLFINSYLRTDAREKASYRTLEMEILPESGKIPTALEEFLQSHGFCLVDRYIDDPDDMYDS